MIYSTERDQHVGTFVKSFTAAQAGTPNTDSLAKIIPPWRIDGTLHRETAVCLRRSETDSQQNLRDLDSNFFCWELFLDSRGCCSDLRC